MHIRFGPFSSITIYRSPCVNQDIVVLIVTLLLVVGCILIYRRFCSKSTVSPFVTLFPPTSSMPTGWTNSDVPMSSVATLSPINHSVDVEMSGVITSGHAEYIHNSTVVQSMMKTI